MRFTQFLFPRGTPKVENIDMPHEVEALADELVAAGWSFEIECSPHTGYVHADCCDEDAPIADDGCANGPGVPTMIDNLVRNAHAEWTRRGKPEAVGRRGDVVRARAEAEWGPQA